MKRKASLLLKDRDPELVQIASTMVKIFGYDIAVVLSHKKLEDKHKEQVLTVKCTNDTNTNIQHKKFKFDVNSNLKRNLSSILFSLVSPFFAETNKSLMIVDWRENVLLEVKP